MSARLPDEEFLTGSGRTFDGTGIPPHLTEPVFTKQEFDEKRDSAFDRALDVLRNHGGTTVRRGDDGTAGLRENPLDTTESHCRAQRHRRPATAGYASPRVPTAGERTPPP